MFHQDFSLNTIHLHHEMMNNGNPRSILFKNFFEEWIHREQMISDELLHSRFLHRNNHVAQNDQTSLISRTLSLYQEYYSEKSRATQTDVFMMFSPPWFTTYEKTFLWIAGFKPGIPFRIVNKSVADLSQEQVQRLNRLKTETKAREKELSDELARIQEGVASSYMAEVASRRGVEEDRREVEVAVGEMREMMETLVQSADILRMTIVREIVEILSPIQSIDFLAAASQIYLRVRRLGLQKDASRR